MKQKKYPCCKEPIDESEVWELIYVDNLGSSSKDFNCPHCGKLITCFLNLESLEVAE